MVTVYGGTPYDKQTRQLRQRADIVVATPGRLEDLLENGYCFFDDIQLTVLDEADHLCDLGFYPSVDKLVGMTPEGSQRMLLSATLDGDVDKLVRTHLRNPKLHELDPNAGSVTTMTHHTLTVGGFREKVGTAVRLVEANGRTIIFTRTREGAVELAEALTNQGVDAVDLHGNLSQKVRERNLHRFSSGKAKAVVATDVAGARHPRRRRRHGHPLRRGQRRQGLPAPQRPYGARRRATARSSPSPRRSSCSRSCASSRTPASRSSTTTSRPCPTTCPRRPCAKHGSPAPKRLLVVVRREALGRLRVRRLQGQQPQVGLPLRRRLQGRPEERAAARARAVPRRTARASPTPGSARPPRADHPRASVHAIASIVSPISTSSTCQARGRVSTGLSRRAPYPSPVNQTTLPAPAPAANHHLPVGPWWAAIEPSRSTVSR